MFNAKEFIENSLKEIKTAVGDSKVISACSGGVDSSVATYLVHKAVGDKLVAVFIDDGLRREGEPEFVVRILKELQIKTRYVDAKAEFFQTFKGKTDAEEKRKAFRDKFYTTLGTVAKEEQIKFITQGTIKADVMETVTPGGADRAGEAHPWGTVILSVPALLASFDDPDDAFHVGVHEFAHLLDVDQTHFDGIPGGLDSARAAEWVDAMEREMTRMRTGRSVLDDYGANDPVEFLAVAVEAFFETPLELRQACPRVYVILGEYFRQDPAAWDDARGLYLED